MAKKEMLVPFINGKPCWYDREVFNSLEVGETAGGRNGYSERKCNYEFFASFEILDFIRGRSSVKLCLVDVNEPEPTEKYGSKFRYEVFLSDAIDTIENSKNRIVTGTWTFVKRGANWGIKLVK